jgi:predicted  nucleic acid-binding Zn-ribbon protein
MSKGKKSKWTYIESLQQTIADANAAIRRLQKELDQITSQQAYNHLQAQADQLRSGNIALAAENTQLQREVKQLKMGVQCE